MNTNDKYTATLKRVSSKLMEAYERNSEVNLLEASTNYVAIQTVIRKTKILMWTLTLLLLIPFPICIFLDGPASPSSNFWPAIATVSCFVILIIGLIVHRKYEKARKVSDASAEVLNKFEGAVEAFELGRHWSSKEQNLFNDVVVFNALVSMARDVVGAESLEECAKKSIGSGFSPSVDEAVSISRNVREKKQRLEEALKLQQLFGLAYTKRELFQKATA